ncbi:MAG: hypothetical protein JW924_13740 [Fusobacteriaceae bacterium]|nr:hypothetical protein [Fusobacteriaceae bacterium]
MSYKFNLTKNIHMYNHLITRITEEVVEILLEKGANKNVRNSEGKSLLEIVDSDEMKEFLIELGVK